MTQERRIEWEDYNENYVVSITADESSDDEFDDNDPDKDSYSDNEIGSSISANLFNFSSYENMIHSPWGPLKKNDPFSPVNFYSMRIMHTYGFAAKTPWYSPEAFEAVLDSIEGVTAWRCVDPYCFILAKARCYEWKFIAQQINKAFGINSGKKNEEEINLIVQRFIEEDQNKTLASIRFSDGEIEQVDKNEDGYTEFLQNLNMLIETGAPEGTVVVIDGEVRLR